MLSRGPHLGSAALLGLGGGLRSFAPPVALALQDRGPLSGPARFIALGAGLGELIGDKQPGMPSRLSPRGLGLRLGFSSAGGHELAGRPGAAVAAAAALGAAVAGSRLRTLVGGGRSGLAAAFAEDALSYALALAGTRARS